MSSSGGSATIQAGFRPPDYRKKCRCNWYPGVGLYMVRISRKFTLILFSGLFFLFLSLPVEAFQRPSPPKSRGKQPQPSTPPSVVPPVPSGPLPQLTLDQMPAIPPQVSYHAGQLTIQAQNSTLGDILGAVRTQTGASFDLPANATERVVGRFGPGPAREVLASLLNGSHFNYVMLGSPTDASAVQQVILTPKPGGATETVSGSMNQPNPVMSNTSRPTGFPVPSGVPAQAQQDGSTEEMQGDNGAETAGDENADQAEQPENDQEGATQGLPQNGAQNAQPTIKTPEQLLQELQRQQQIQQQQQQSQSQQQPQPQLQPQVVYPVNQPPNRPEQQPRPPQ